MKCIVNLWLIILIFFVAPILKAQVTTVLAPGGKRIGIDKTSFGLSNVDNTSDLDKPISTTLQSNLNLKEDLSNKSLNVTIDASSDIKYPSVKAVKSYIDRMASWSTTGNAGIFSLGVSDNGGGSFQIYTNNLLRLRIGSNGKVSTYQGVQYDFYHNFHISSLQIQDGTQGAGKYLICDANGLASWQNIDFNAFYSSFSLPNTIVAPITSLYTGRVWMDRNLGASRRATSKDDIQAYGQLYQWGRGNDGHADYYIWNNKKQPIHGKTAVLSSTDYPETFEVIASQGLTDWRATPNDNLWQGVNGINNPCPSGYRLPTAAEFQAEITAAGLSDINSAFASFLKLPAAGVSSRNDASVNDLGVRGLYWTSTVGSNAFSFGSGVSNYSEYRSFGMSVRCIKN